jgi:glycosyltransferase involved in cell wall biosynthesis
MHSPLITISLPIYNADKYLAECIKSIKTQTCEDFEVIAVLDGCTDRSEEILMDLKDERFIVIKKVQNEGKVAASNAGLFHGRGEYFCRTDADDTLHSNKLKLQSAFLRAHSEIDVIGAYFDYINERGEVLRGPFPFSLTHENILNEFRVRNPIGGPTALCRREKLVAIGGFSLSYWQCEDLELWLHCLAEGFHFSNLSEVLYHYRVHGAQDSTRLRSEVFRLTKAAYQLHGRKIWGDHPPDGDYSESLWRLAGRYVKRKLHKLVGTS